MKEENTVFNAQALLFAEMLRPQKIPKDGRYNLFAWDVLDYAVAEAIIRHSWSAVYPDKEQPKLKDVKELITWHTKEEQLLKPFSDWVNKKNCKKELMENYVRRESKIYSDYLNSLQ